MFFVDRHVAGMLYDSMPDNVNENIYRYSFDTFKSGQTVILGEWIEKNGESFFLCHSWKNGQ